MDQIAFEVVDGGDHDGDTVRILINGLDLAEMAHGAAPPQAGSDRGYRGLPWKLATSRHLLGEPEPLYQAGARIYVLACDCNDFGCWPLLARVTLTETEVTWADFHQAHKRGQPVPLPAFRFARAQYEAAWRTLRKD